MTYQANPVTALSKYVTLIFAVRFPDIFCSSGKFSWRFQDLLGLSAPAEYIQQYLLLFFVPGFVPTLKVES